MTNERLGRVGKLGAWGLGGMMTLLPACGGSTALGGSADWDSALQAAAASVESTIGTIDSSGKVYVQWQRPDVDVIPTSPRAILTNGRSIMLTPAATAPPRSLHRTLQHAAWCAVSDEEHAVT